MMFFLEKVSYLATDEHGLTLKVVAG